MPQIVVNEVFIKLPDMIQAEAAVLPMHPSVDVKDAAADIQLDILIEAGGAEGANAQAVADHMAAHGLSFGPDFGDPTIIKKHYSIG